MKHDFIDKYSHLDSWLHRLDPRSKLFLCFALIVIFIATNRLKLFIFYYALLVLLVWLSKVPAAYFLKRALLVTPFVVLITLFMLGSAALAPSPQDPLGKGFNHPVYLNISLIVLKTYASIIMLTLLTSVTRFNCLLWAMRKSKFPSVVTTLSRLIYTYTFLLVDELHATLRAVKSRAPVLKMRKVKVYGNVAASILLKSISRAQMIYYAMVSRKFSGEFPEGAVNRFTFADLFAGTCFVLLLVTIYLLWNR